MKQTIKQQISPFRLSYRLRDEPDPKLALNLFQNPNPNPNPKPFRYSLRSYDIIITKLGRAKMFDSMEKILHQLKTETRFSTKEELFCKIMSFYGRAGLASNALKVFDEMPEFRCQRSVKSVNSLLNALLMCGEFDKLREVFYTMEDYAKPDACTYNVLIHCFCKRGKLDDACKVLVLMRERGISPNVVTFGTLVHAFCLNSRLIEALKLRYDMARVYGVCPDSFIYASLMKGLCMGHEVSLAFKLKEEMVENKVKLDPAIYSTLISGLIKAGRKDEIHGVLEEMEMQGCKPCTVTYNAMINGLCKDREFELAYKLLDEMVEKGCKPDVISFNVILSELCKEGKCNEAYDLFQDMPRRGCAPDVMSYRTVFNGLSDGMQFEDAAFVLDEMVFKGFSPHPCSTHKFVERLCQESKYALLQSILNSLAKGNAIDVDSWKTIVTMILKEQQPSNANEIVERLVAP